MIIYGKQLFFYLLNSNPKAILEVYLAKECDKKEFSQIASLKVPIVRVEERKAQALARGGNHQGYIAKIEPVAFATLQDVKESNFLVMLYGLTDMGNIGAICRSAYALGADALVIAGVKNVNLEPLLRTSSGAGFEMPLVHVVDGLSALNELKQVGFKIYGADAKGEDVARVHVEGKSVLVMGSEGEGIPKKALAKCDELVRSEEHTSELQSRIRIWYAVCCL